MKTMELHQPDHETVSSHPILFIVFIFTWILGAIALTFEDYLQQVDIVLSIIGHLITPISAFLFLIVYWDKIKTNFKLFKEDVKLKRKPKK